jgi:hypothetical protein
MSVNPDEKAVARRGLRSINPTSIEKNVEYFFLIYKTKQGYASTTPNSSGSQDGIAEDQIKAALSSVPAGAKVTAFAHTHGKNIGGYISEGFSREDVDFARSHSWNSYLATPSSQLVILDESEPRDIFNREAL